MTLYLLLGAFIAVVTIGITRIVLDELAERRKRRKKAAYAMAQREMESPSCTLVDVAKAACEHPGLLQAVLMIDGNDNASTEVRCVECGLKVTSHDLRIERLRWIQLRPFLNQRPGGITYTNSDNSWYD